MLALKNQEISEPNPEIKYKCKKCTRIYKNKSYLNYHEKYECGVMPQFTCKFCGHLFKRNSHMNEHIDQVHQNTSSTKSVLLMHKCDICPRSYIWRTHLSRHKRLVHAAVKPQFICDCCGYKSDQKSNLAKHMTTVHSQISRTRHGCDQCLRSYTCLRGLNRHKRVHHAIV
ncbi:zinc finger protein 502-like [Belonocnema kinseyi]|uniref:zinc finger protein 502-like n=1 Tax=Belonocnema kinseyi TaxID=2817044 RepID=UPI00143CFBB4|nr:zinc finger protein 502-like [Belonocnema kinseyi]